jgi:hypothetical protein
MSLTMSAKKRQNFTLLAMEVLKRCAKKIEVRFDRVDCRIERYMANVVEADEEPTPRLVSTAREARRLAVVEKRACRES